MEPASPGALQPGAARGAVHKVQPASLAGHVAFSTPLGARSMALAARGQRADEGTVYGSKVGWLSKEGEEGQHWWSGWGGGVNRVRCQVCGVVKGASNAAVSTS